MFSGPILFSNINFSMWLLIVMVRHMRHTYIHIHITQCWLFIVKYFALCICATHFNHCHYEILVALKCDFFFHVTYFAYVNSSCTVLLMTLKRTHEAFSYYIYVILKETFQIETMMFYKRLSNSV